VRPAEYAKAIAGALIAGLGVLYVAIADDVVTAQEWVGVAGTCLTAFATVWGVPNAPKTNLVTQQTFKVETQDVPGPDHRADSITGL
jgi:hypothetical protein